MDLNNVLKFVMKRIESGLSLKLLSIVSVATSLTSCDMDKETRRADNPNIIFILADDLGYADLSCMGQTKFSTPNIDRLASQGMIFTQHYSGSSVSAPSRSCLITGQHTGHTVIRGNKELPVEGQYPLPSDTFPMDRNFSPFCRTVPI